MTTQKTFTMGQWTLVLDVEDGTTKLENYRFSNFGDDGIERFYASGPGKYGQPLIHADPALAFDCSGVLYCVDASGAETVPTEKIAGLICKDGPRLSLSNAKKQGIDVIVNADGSVQIGDETWWIATLFSKDRNRVIGYDAYCVRTKPERVRVLELGDLNLFNDSESVAA